MNRVYPAALGAFLRGDVHWLTDTINAVLLDGYTYNDSHQWLTDLASFVVGTQTLAGRAVAADGIATANDVTFPSVTSGYTITALAIYVDTGTPATSRLLAYIDTRGDTMPINVETNGTNLTVLFADTELLRL